MRYEYKTQPRDAQVRALRAAYKKDVFAFLMEMGTGKTKVAIDEMSEAFERRAIEGCVIMAPKGVYMNWIREPDGEIPIHMPDRVRAKADIVHWVAGGGPKYHQKLLFKLMQRDGRFKILVMNTEAVQQPGKARDFLEAFLRTIRCAMYIDESTGIKNVDAIRTRYVCKVVAPETVFRRIMTGLPNPRSPLDIYGQYAFLRRGLLGFTNYVTFRARYGVIRKIERPRTTKDGRQVTYKAPLVVGYRNLEELKQRVAKHSFRVTKEECLDLSPKVYMRRDVDMTKEQVRAYEELRRYATTQLDSGEHVTTTQKITTILRLHQICCGHVHDENGKLHLLPTHRPTQLLEAIEEMPNKILIWAAYKPDVYRVVEALSKEHGERSVVQFHGDVKQKDREKADARFKRDDDCRFLVGTANTGGRGNTWVVAKHVIFYSTTNDLELRFQAEDRAHRSGQDMSVTYLDLICPGTVEEKIIKALRAKIDLAGAVTGDKYRQWLI